MRTLSIAALTLVLSPPVQTAGVSAIDDFVGPPITTANGCPANVEWDPEVIAKAVGLTLDEYFRMRDLRGLTPDDFCWMPRDKLVRAKVKTAKPKPDNPGAWAIFRAMQQSDEKGEVKADGWKSRECARRCFPGPARSSRRRGCRRPSCWVRPQARRAAGSR